MQALLGYVSEARWLRHARKHLTGLFPYLPGQSGYNKRLRKLAATMMWLIRVLATDTSLWADDVWVIDSTPVECGRSRQTAQRSDLAGYAQYGYCASRCVLSGVRSPACSAIVHPFRLAMPLATALTYLPACSHGSTRAKHDRSSPASSDRFRRPSPAPILAAAAAADSVVRTNT
jgi:hypothetical protein